MKLSDYKNNSFVTIELPSGAKARLKQVKMMGFVLSGSIPNIFDLSTGTVDMDKKGDLGETKELVENVICDCVDRIIFEDGEAVLVNKTASECKQNEISYVDHWSNDDAMEIFLYAFEKSAPAQGGAGKVSEFRQSS